MTCHPCHAVMTNGWIQKNSIYRSMKDQGPNMDVKSVSGSRLRSRVNLLHLPAPAEIRSHGKMGVGARLLDQPVHI